MTSYAITAGAIDITRMRWRSLSTCWQTHCEEAQRATHGELEALVQVEGSELLRRLIQGTSIRGSREPMRERVVGADGVARTHRREGCSVAWRTRFGK